MVVSECTCPKDPKSIPANKRVMLLEPGAEVRQGRTVKVNPDKIIVWHKDCPVHGVVEINEEGDQIADD
ncbi:hypothetical protein RPALISO_112 [Ruegeria phage RpAliso]|nr:hypothetical protein RPALISO_112 [Ruegeria phage RpAliso]